MKSKTKTNRTSYARLYPHFEQKRKWFERGSYIPRRNLIVREKGVLRRTVGSDWRKLQHPERKSFSESTSFDSEDDFCSGCWSVRQSLLTVPLRTSFTGTIKFHWALTKLQVIPRNSDWFVALFAPVVIGRGNYFTIGFSTVSCKPLHLLWAQVVQLQTQISPGTVLGKILDARVDERSMLETKPTNRLLLFSRAFITKHLGLTQKGALSQANINAIQAM